MYRHFATFVSYPASDLHLALDAGIEELGPRLPEAAELLERFRESAKALGPGALEETYIRTFEMRAETALYVGHQIFGEDWRRGIFMAGLKEQYRPFGLLHGVELPDHLGVVLRFLEVQPPGPEKEELIWDCIVPALRKVLGAVEGESPYRDVLNALLLCFTPERLGGLEYDDHSCSPSSLSLFPILP